MKFIKVKRDGKLDVLQTIQINIPVARTPKHKRKSYKQIKETAARRRRDARLLKTI